MGHLPLMYPLRNLRQRAMSSGLTLGGIALVVVTFVGVLSMAEGLTNTFKRAGGERNVLFMRHGAASESASAVPRDRIGRIEALTGIARGRDHRALVSPEVLVQVLMTRADGVRVNVALRGVRDTAFAVRDQLAVTAGRRPGAGTLEVLVGRTLASSFQGLGLGDTLRIGRLRLTVVGHVSADGSALESEIWMDQDQVMAEYHAQHYASVLVRLEHGHSIPDFVAGVRGDPAVGLNAMAETDYYAELQTGASEVRWLGLLMTLFMACGATFGAMNTMYQAVAGRTRELATLRVLGFSRPAILLTILVEAIVLSGLGGVLGTLLCTPLGGWELRTVNVKTLTEVGYHLEITPRLVTWGLLLSVGLGVLGGLLPAWQATRLKLSDALRQA